MLRTRALIALILAASVGTGACGGSGSDRDAATEAKRLSRAEWASRADALCVDKSERLDELNATAEDGLDEEGLENLLRRVLASEEKWVDDVRALAAPRADEAKVREMLRLHDEGNSAFAETIETRARKDQASAFEALARANNLWRRSGEIAADLGATECNQPVSWQLADVLLSDDFSDESPTTWEEGAEEGTDARVVGGAYRLAVLQRNKVAVAGAVLERPVGAISFDLDMTMLRSARAPEYGAAGCVGGDGGYNFAVGPTVGYYAIMKVTPRGIQLLREGQRPGIIRGLGERNHIRAECVGGRGDRPTTLRLTVNDKTVLEIRDRGGSDQFSAASLVVFSAGRGTTFEFDNVIVQRL
jgi:hypothetical protein